MLEKSKPYVCPLLACAFEKLMWLAIFCGLFWIIMIGNGYLLQYLDMAVLKPRFPRNALLIELVIILAIISFWRFSAYHRIEYEKYAANG